MQDYARLPLLLIGAQQNRFAELPKKARDRFAGEGLLIPAGTNVKGEQLHTGGGPSKLRRRASRRSRPASP